MSITVVDSIMGSGKSTWAFEYMNSHPDGRYIFITQYLEECDRVADACPNLNFWKPKEPSKQLSFLEGIKRKRNIATTHSLFQQLTLTNEKIAQIQDLHYTVFLDEVVETVQPFPGLKKADYSLIKDSGWIIVTEDGSVSLTEKGKNATQTRFRDALDFIAAGSVFLFEDMLLLWVLPPETLRLSDDIYILTYMFEASHLMHTLSIYGYDYQIAHIEPNPYRLVDGYETDLGEKKARIDQLIDILDDDWNSIGQTVYAKKNREYTFSSTWWEKAPKSARTEAANHIRNYFRYKATDRCLSYKECMWSIVGQTENTKKEDRKISVKDYDRSCLAFNKRATNKYADAIALACLFNVYEHPVVDAWFESKNEHLDKDKYALSVLLQWIWRSAIRNEHNIHLYIPSSRMRNLLKYWIEDR